MAKFFFKHLACIILLLGIAGFSFKEVKEASRKALTNLSSNEALYLPRGDGLHLMSFGYQSTLAHLLWFNTINYFGKHFQGNRDYRWLSHMCGLVTQLNPKMIHVYEFCGLMLAWEAKEYEKSISLLTLGIKNNPNYWKLPYLRGMNSLLFSKDEASATADFIAASKLPDAHHGVVSLAARKLSISENPETAIEFLKESIKSSKDDWEREVLTERLKEYYMKRDLNVLEQALEIYQQRMLSAPENLEALVEHGIIKSLPLDPFGGKYTLNKLTGKPESTSQTDGKTDSNSD